ncbi:hypothetical protein RA210_U90003 [Rubrivivax sp. A210]|nr:hypothetical protein RA210_U90003 [Rubrivivax sp. A210]
MPAAGASGLTRVSATDRTATSDHRPGPHPSLWDKWVWLPKVKTRHPGHKTWPQATITSPPAGTRRARPRPAAG